LNRREGGKSKAVSFPSLLNVIKGYLHLVREIYFPKNGAKTPLQRDSVSSRRRIHDEEGGERQTNLAARDPSAARQVPYVDLADQHVPIKAELLRAIGGVLDRGQFILGDEVAEFEKRFAELCGVRHAVAVNSGTDALVFALRSLGIGSGDEVITAPNSFIASTSCIVIAGARPVFVDVRDDYNLDPEKLAAAITPRTKAILPVHLTGRPADMDPILAIAKARGLAAVEDCAQAILAEYRGQRVGALGNVGCFSLHPLKTLNACGDGGVLTTDDDAICQQARLHRNLGLQNRSDCVLWASNSRLDSLQAAILLVKLNYLAAWTERRRENAAFYQQALGDLAECRLPQDRPHEKAVYHTFVIQAQRRDELKQYLSDRGVGTSVHYPVPIHLQTVAAGLGYRRGCFPVTERQAGQILSLPVHHRMSAADLQYVSQAIRSFYGR
jgi:dTDP-4-amino-4,6-dideoxygalactose transaminase